MMAEAVAVYKAHGAPAGILDNIDRSAVAVPGLTDFKKVFPAVNQKGDWLRIV
jgi:hypothetical protein